jgi:hypothetical protein
MTRLVVSSDASPSGKTRRPTSPFEQGSVKVKSYPRNQLVMVGARMRADPRTERPFVFRTPRMTVARIGPETEFSLLNFY